MAVITFESLAEVFNEEEINTFQIFKVGDTLNTGMLMSGISNFIDFIKSANVKRVYIYEHFEDAEDYYITEEVLSRVARYEDEEFLEYIYPQISEYNKKISNLDFEFPSWVAAICFCDNEPFFIICNNDRTLNGEELRYPEEEYKIIRLSNEEHRQMIQEDTKNKIETLREELRQQILSDKDFKLCTNQELRRNYAHNLFRKLQKKFEPLKKVMYQGNLSILSVAGRDFIELLWREVKEENMKKQ